MDRLFVMYIIPDLPLNAQEISNTNIPYMVTTYNLQYLLYSQQAEIFSKKKKFKLTQCFKACLSRQINKDNLTFSATIVRNAGERIGTEKTKTHPCLKHVFYSHILLLLPTLPPALEEPWLSA